MTDLGHSNPPDPASPRGDRLDSWKAIATYLKRDVRTVQRWERKEGLPVHRHLHASQELERLVAAPGILTASC